MIEKFTAITSPNGLMADKLNEVIDAVNELCSRAGINTPIKPQNNENITERELREMMRDPKYWRDQDPEYTRKIENGFKNLYGNKD